MCFGHSLFIVWRYFCQNGQLRNHENQFTDKSIHLTKNQTKSWMFSGKHRNKTKKSSTLLISHMYFLHNKYINTHKKWHKNICTAILFQVGHRDLEDILRDIDLNGDGHVDFEGDPPLALTPINTPSGCMSVGSMCVSSHFEIQLGEVPRSCTFVLVVVHREHFDSLGEATYLGVYLAC